MKLPMWLSAFMAVAITLPIGHAKSDHRYRTKTLRLEKVAEYPSRNRRKLHPKSKKWKTSAPSTSAMPSTVPSLSPSMAPSVSAQPSSIPSVSPTSRPSTSPSASPSASPSISMKPSSNPSSQPTSKPSSPPTSMPSSSPSVAPTGHPSVSMKPSSLPSASPSSAPSVHMVTGRTEVEGGIQDGCPVPAFLTQQNFAEASVQKVPVSFIYAILFDTISDGTDEDEVIESYIYGLEWDLQNYVFNEFVDCESMAWENSRKLETYNRPIGSSSVPVDEKSESFICSGTKEDQTCLPINGRFTLLYTDEAEINIFEEEMHVLSELKDAIDKGHLRPSNSNVTVVFYGKEGQPNSSTKDFLIPKATRQESLEESGENITVGGGLMIAMAALMFALALFAGGRRRRRARFERMNEGALTTLRGGQRDVNDREYDLFEIQEDDDVFEVVPPGSQKVDRSRSLFQDSDSSVDPIDYTCDVHRCHSATCQECARSRKGVQFISTSQWYDNSAINFQSVRSFDTSNTVEL